MHRGRLVVAIVIVVVAAACSNGSGATDEVGDACRVVPGTVCRDQDLQSVSLVAADLRGADFSGSDLTSADLRGADLTGAKFVGSNLGAADFTGATLRDADLSKASTFYTNFTDADITGANRTDLVTCNTIEPDGALDTGSCFAIGAVSDPRASKVTGPPVIESFRPQPPGGCLNDAAGTGIEVEWKTRNTTSITFSVNGIRIDSDTKARGSRRLPFVCNNKPHLVTMSAFGPFAPSATATFTVAYAETAPLAPDDS